jgi:hypothetical protein
MHLIPNWAWVVMIGLLIALQVAAIVWHWI